MAYVDLPPHADTSPPVSPLVSPLIEGFPTVPTSNVTAQQRASARSDAFDVSPLLRGARSPTEMSRSGSISSFSNNSTRASQLPSSPTNVHPPPAYVAPFGASQVVSERKRRFSDDEDDDVRTSLSTRDDMQFSASSLVLLNAFLDQLLYSILGHAKSTTLTALRPAVTEVLKARLAAEAIASAEEELQELLAGGEDEEEEMNHRQTVAERSRTWDTELVWKRTRLRVMVYIRLGEMEDDDEERYVREDELFHSSDRRFSHSTGLVSWAAAIFLTSVVEYVAEQVLQAAGQAADSRVRRQSKNPRLSMSASSMVTPGDGVTVEDYDMEKVALNSTLGRLWRTWRKSLRNNANGAPPTSNSPNNFSRRFSRDIAAGLSPGRGSFGIPEAGSAMQETQQPTVAAWDRDASESNVDDLPEAQYPEHVLAANIPLPLDDAERDVEEIEHPEHIIAAKIPLPLVDSKRDVDEIEVPGLATDPDDAETDGGRTPRVSELKRRNSLTGSAPLSLINRLLSIVKKPESATDDNSNEKPTMVEAIVSRKRASSLPKGRRLDFFAPDQQTRQENEAEQEQESQKEIEKAENAETVSEDTQPETVIAGETADRKVEPLPVEDTLAQVTDDEPKHHEGEPVTSQSPAAVAAAQAMSEEAKPDENESAASKASATSAAVQATSEAPKQHENGTVFGKATAGSAAAAAAAVAAIYGSSKLSQPALPRSAPVSEVQVDERDNQKQLVDVKRLSLAAAANKKEDVPQKQERPQTAKRMSLTQVQSPPVVVKTRSRSGTPESFSLADKDEKPLEKPLTRPSHLSKDVGDSQENLDNLDAADVDIGVARTSDTAVSTPPADEPPQEWRYARDSFTNPAPRRQSRLILGADAPASLDRREELPQRTIGDVTPASFLEKRALSVTRKSIDTDRAKKSSQSPHDQTRSPAPKSPNRASAPTALNLAANGSTSTTPQPSPRLEKTPSPWRQSFSAATTNGSWAAVPKKESQINEPAVAVQEHPVVQKIASMKNADSSRPKEEEKTPLVSASIKGPEDFEMFVQGGDTVKYTLTPENVRDRVSPSDAVPHAKVRSVERASSSGKDDMPPPEDRLGRSHSTKHATAATPIPPEPADDSNVSVDKERNREKRRSISRPPVRNTSVHRKSGLIAREPQVVTESTRDFADFIRSTGPTKEPEFPLLTSKSTTSLHSMRPSSTGGSRSSSPGGRSLNRVQIPTTNIPPIPAMPRGKSHMQPRGATSNTDSGTSELIDFIRSGPNGSSQSGQQRQHRISRTVAPFRTTMDSDQMNEWGDRIAAQPDLKLDTKINAAPSLKSASSLKTNRTSANSRSALLSNSIANDSVHPAHSGQPQRLSGKPLSAPPEKKRYRGKDPYSMDFLDDEDDDLLTALPANKREEESLMDFLRNSEPPSDSGNGPGGAQTRPSSGSRRGSAPALRTHGADAVSMGRRGSNSSKDAPSTKTVANMAAPRMQGMTSVAVGPITKPRPKLEARDVASATSASTNDLADFLRTSGPTANAAPRPTVAARQSSKISLTSSSKSKSSSRISGFFSSGFFSSRKPASGKTYLDM